MSADDPHAAGEGLQFDRVVGDAPVAVPQGGGQPAVTCTSCSKPISSDYYHVNGRVTCQSCRNAIEMAVATPEGAGPFIRAAGLGLGAAIAGAALYYGVIALANLEIGIIAIAIGYMVGWAVMKGAGGVGGRRYQVLAMVLTYWAVGLAYAPLILRNSTMPLVSQFFEVFALPIMVVTGGGSGIITAIIIAVGLRQAWRMTAAPVVTYAGPFRVGSG